MKVHLRALGCRLNEAELETWSQEFQKQGYHISENSGDVDLVVLNTCAVTNDASRKSRNLINRLHRENPTAKLIVSGCHSSLNPESVAQTLGVDLVVSNLDKSRLTEIAKAELDLPTMPFSATEPDDIALYTRGRHRAFIKIQDGCRYRCTFCIVTVARGEERSRSTKEIIDEINHFHASGIQEVVLTGVHVGGFGADIGSSLYELVQTILEDTDIPRLRFASVEPWDLPENFFELFLNPRVMPHMHLPLQSGADSVLRRMARRCKTEQFAELARQAREAIPHFNITSDIIAGFPGETEEEWAQTMAFCERMEFGHLHIFPYSPREGTKAAGLPSQIPKPLAQERCRQLATLADNMKQQALKKMAGQRNVPVLWERPSRSNREGYVRFSGYTPNYLRVETEVPTSVDLEYSITPVSLSGINEEKGCLTGTVDTATPQK